MKTDSKQQDFKREVFTTSRELEYFSESELVTQTGYDRENWWPGVLVKELMDNSLDACEQAGVAPRISVRFSREELVVADNGPGLPADVLARILDFSSRTSDKAAYISPTRGAQGNALKTILAIPFVLNEGSPATIQIEACGRRHFVTVSTDHVLRRPQIEHRQEKIVKTEGTAIHVRLVFASSETSGEDAEFLQKLLFDYSLFNPHATFSLCQDGPEHTFEQSTDSWRKWTPAEPTSAHWYDLASFQDLVACYIAAEQSGARPRTVREFVSEFRGFSGSLKQKQIVTGAGLDRAYLHDLLSLQGQFDRSSLRELLNAMQQSSAPVKPELLGVLGEDHFRRRMHGAVEDQSFRYRCFKGTDGHGLPYVVECAFVLTDNPLLQGAHIGLNWSVPLSDPIQENEFTLAKGDSVWGLPALLANCRINLEHDPVCLVLHLICPQFQFLDRGKGSVSLTFAEAVGKAVLETTKEWSAIKKKQERDQKQAGRMVERYSSGRSSRVTVKEAAYRSIPAAYAKASGGGQYPANARQIMYAARPNIQEMTGQALSDTYFTQTLLPDFVREHPQATSEWDVVYDARGHLWEPHTEREVGLGTLGVREYLVSMRNCRPGDAALETPELPIRCTTYGPHGRYGAILYVEKEGFLPLLQQAGIAERYDLAIMSSKGMGTTAVRTLIERLCREVRILVLHDFDKSGFSIVGTLTRDTRRYSYATAPKVVDLGLRLRDVEEWNLQSEDVTHSSDPAPNLILNGATAEEVVFLRGESASDYDPGRYKGRRVELNAFTSAQFVEWLESKLTEHQIEKVVPDATTLAEAYRRAAGIRRYRLLLRNAVATVNAYAAGVEIPANLKERLVEILAKDPSVSWDLAIESLLVSQCGE
jgi:DNA topoisomerase VI subunit B